MFKAAWETGQEHTQLRNIALEWLRASSDHRAWQLVFELLWVADPEQRGELRMHALAWLTANPEHKGWRPVFELLWVGDPEQRGSCVCTRSPG